MAFPGCEPRFGTIGTSSARLAYARHMHELDTEERNAKAIRRRAQLRVVAGTALDE